MAPPVLLASDCMDQAAIMLNDVGRNLYTNAIQLPYLKMANEALEQLLLKYGVSIQLKKTTAITVALSATPTTLTLPSDFLLPITLWERASGSTNEDDYVEMFEKDWEEDTAPANTLNQWSFRNNTIALIGCTVAREVKLYYHRMILAITSANSPEESYLFKPYLSAKTAEYCARFIGMNKEMADEIQEKATDPAEDNLTHILIGNMQGARHRRGQYTTKQPYLIR